MCGITGAYFFNKDCNLAVVKQMTNALAHRGPDAEGFFEDHTLALGHRRLSIIDLSAASNQPLYDNTQQYVMVFNGEIYNYQEIKNTITDYDFKTNGDGEVVLAAYIKWGVAALQMLKGFFAFAIYHKSTQKLFIARDRLGVKPLYFYKDDQVFLFASEIRAILASGLVPKKMNMQAVQCYLQMQSFYAPNTIIENVQQLKNGYCLSLENNAITQTQYWNICTKNETLRIGSTREEVKEDVLALLQQSIKRRLVADVPVAAFLSGGIDSSAIVGLMAQQQTNVETFNIAFAEKEYDESEYAEIIAKKFNTKHHKIIVQPTNFLEELPNALAAMDIPTADGINSYVVSKAIKNKGIRVAVSGVGGDELFAGYPSFNYWSSIQQKKWLWQFPKWTRTMASSFLPNAPKWQRVKKLLQTPHLSIDNFYPLMREILPKATIEKITKQPFSYPFASLQTNAFPLISQYTIAELLGYTQQTLLKDTDQFSMAVALEVREPFFDSDLIEYVLQIPDAIKKPTYPKQLLVESLGDLLPSAIVHRPKKGFTFPWDFWMRNELKTFCETKIQNLANREEFNGIYIKELWQQFLQQKNVRWPEVWQLVCLADWLDRNI
jgi:asparagine synthase (glutamine-hydrolysing)